MMPATSPAPMIGAPRNGDFAKSRYLSRLETRRAAEGAHHYGSAVDRARRYAKRAERRTWRADLNQEFFGA